MERVLQLGPLVLPWAMLILLAGWQLGSLVYERLSARQGLAPGPHGWRLALLALLAARLAFVLRYAGEYGAAPWSVIDIRDGGWEPWAGLGTALLYVAALWLRRSPWRQTTAAGLAAFAALWFTGLALLQATAPSGPAGLPAWRGVALDARSLALPDLRGQAVVVNLWASWCPPCRREMPVLLQARQAHAQLRFLWINQGEAPEVVTRFAAQQGLPATDVLLDPASQLGQALGHKALPTTLFYDAQGRLRAVRAGELSAATLAHHLAQITGAKP
ncbi:TlpA family protein disulfide reductase [Alicycliphilus denitrificans]|uniref:TlpA family protein disulfide reductase n=1 Tax=Alicycliphilus denitrificans TaxID=179636 RepID=UPI0038509077